MSEATKETAWDKLMAYAQFVADTKCKALALDDYYYEFDGDITVLIQHNKVTAHNLKTEEIAIALPKENTNELTN